ncbi:MAG: hypothetical protein H0T62_12080 [Parachlamydiaceae bacterium]|nr:hypothetical protein [Parachlamydiaceae bacterium]
MFFKTRYSVLSTIFILYLVPLCALGFYNKLSASNGNWGFFCLALLILALGSLLFFLLITQWENQLSMKYLLTNDDEVEECKNSTFLTPVDEAVQEEQFDRQEQLEEYAQQFEDKIIRLNSQNELLLAELQEKKDAISQLSAEKSQLEKDMHALQREFNQFKESLEEKLEQNHIFLHEHQQTILEQRQAIELKQQSIQLLEDKVRDLTYEIKTLLHLAEKTQSVGQGSFIIPKEPILRNSTGGSQDKQQLSTAERQQSNGSEASEQLKRCIEIAQKMTGASHGSGRIAKGGELPIEHYALNLRSLFESLRSENSCAIMIYSQKENKLIFGNNQIKTLLGWNAEKFIQNFSSIIEESSTVWKSSLAQLAYKNECRVELSMKSKQGALIPVKCHLGIISTGIFRSNILGLLYEGAETEAVRY